MSNRTTNSQRKKQKPSFASPDWGRIGKLGTILLGLLYVVGILTVNTYLYVEGIGTAEFSFLKAHYIYTGVLTMAPIAVFCLLPLFGLFFLKNPNFDMSIDDEMKKRLENSIFYSPINWLINSIVFRLFVFLAFFLMPLILNELFMFLIDSDASESVRILTGIKMYYLSVITAIIAWSILLSLSEEHEEGEKKQFRTLQSVVVPFLTIIMFVGISSQYLTLFTSNIYTNVPRQFGGGKPSINKFLFFSDKMDTVSELKIDIPPGSKLSVPLSLLYETNDTYVVKGQNGRVIRLSKKLIAAVEVVDPF